MYRLMIKTHNKTNLKYLCITKRIDWINYTGSGSQWIKHLKKHGFDFSTELIFQSEDYEEFLGVCLITSEKLNVALSNEFANIIPETGYENDNGYCNLELFWKYASEEVKQEIYKKRNDTLMSNGNHWSVSDKRQDVIESISKANSKFFANLSLEERRLMTEKARAKALKVLEDKTSEKYILWKSKLSSALKEYYINAPREIISEKNRKARLNTSEESKAARKEKIQELYKSGKYDYIFKRYSEERKGIDNPAAKLITWMGIVYTKMKFESEFGKIDSPDIKDCFDNRSDCFIMYTDDIEYSRTECPHCGKFTDKKPSSFKRWHFDNCKKKDKNEKIDRN